MMRRILAVLMMLSGVLWADPLIEEGSKPVEPPKPTPAPEDPKPADPPPEPVKESEAPGLLDLPASGKISRACGVQKVLTAVGVRIVKCLRVSEDKTVVVEVKCWNGSDWVTQPFEVKERESIGRIVPRTAKSPQLDCRTYWKVVDVGDPEEKDVLIPIPTARDPNKTRKDTCKDVRTVFLRHEWAKDPKTGTSLEGEMNKYEAVKLPQPPPESDRPAGKPGPPVP